MTGSLKDPARRRAAARLAACASWVAALGTGLPHLAVAKVGNARFSPWKGGATPALALKDSRGRAFDLASYRGQVVLVNFWATWCEPCIEELPSLEALQDKMKGKAFALLTVNMEESDAKVGRFLQSTLLQEDSLTVLYDRFGTVAKDWKARILPASFLIGPDGRIRQTLVGAADWTSTEIVTQIERLLPANRSGKA
jgi:thiol-disulfide isomerase/thioredoxin